MKHEELPRYTRKTWLITLACTLGAASGGVLLYLDFFSAGAEHSGPPMAVLEKREARVRRLAVANTVWHSIDENENLYRKETLQTGAASAAVVRLNDGSQVELGENSLIVIDDVKNLSLSFLKGSAVFRDIAGVQQSITLGPDGKARIQELPIRLLLPEALAGFHVQAKTRKLIPFSWKAADAASEISDTLLQLSTERSFRAGVTQQLKPESGGSEVRRELPPGNYFWRLVSKKEPIRPLSQVRQFRIHEVEALLPVAPAEDELLRVFGNGAGLPFRWSSGTPGSPTDSEGVHEIEISSQPDFSSVALRQTVSAASQSATLRGIPDGTAYWRIRSRFGDLTLSSRPVRFRVERTRTVPVALNFPLEGAALPLQPPPRFSWTTDSAEVQYLWELQELTDPSKPGTSILSQPVVGGSWIWNNPKPGTYRWRVIAQWNNQTVGESAWRPLVIAAGAPLALVEPAKGRRVLFWQKPPAFTFKWKSDELLQTPGFQYHVELASDHAFQQRIASRKTQQTELAGGELLPTGSGTRALFWRVSIMDPSGQTVKMSEVSTLVYGAPPVLAAPGIDPGQNAEVFNVRDSDHPVILHWKAVDDATKYEFSLEPIQRGPANLRQPDGLKLFSESPQLELPKLPEGKYRWTVRAVDPLGRLGEPSQPLPVEITLGPRLRAPKIISSEVQ